MRYQKKNNAKTYWIRKNTNNEKQTGHEQTPNPRFPYVLQITLALVSLSGSRTNALTSSLIQSQAAKWADKTASLWPSSSCKTLSEIRMKFGLT